MVKPRLAILIRFLPVLALFSCVPPKAVIVPEPQKKKQPEPEVVSPEPSLPPMQDDGIRLPDNIMSMPGDEEFKAAVPTPSPINPLPGSINVRPPTEPPARPKPKTDE